MSVSELERLVPTEIRNVSFPVLVRGYERAAVDAYVQRVNRAIAELEVGRSPHAAVRARPRAARSRPAASSSGRRRRRTRSQPRRGRKRRRAAPARRPRRPLSSTPAPRRTPNGPRRRGRRQGERRGGADPRPLASRGGGDPHPLARRRPSACKGQKKRPRHCANERSAEARPPGRHPGNWGCSSALLDDIRRTAARLEQMAGEAAARFPPGSPPSRPSKGRRRPKPKPKLSRPRSRRLTHPRRRCQRQGLTHLAMTGPRRGTPSRVNEVARGSRCPRSPVAGE